MENLLTVDEVAAHLRLHPFTILGYIRSGLLRGAKLGRVYRIPESELVNFIEISMTSEPILKKAEIKKSEAANQKSISRKNISISLDTPAKSKRIHKKG